MGTNKTKLQKIHKLQKEGVRIISYAAKTAHFKSLMKHHNIFILESADQLLLW